MLLERGDVNPDQPDTEYGRTPLSWAAENGHEGVVKMFLEWRDIRKATLDGKNTTPLSLSLSDGHYGTLAVPLERRNDNYTATDRRARTTLPPSAVNANRSVVGIQFIPSDPNTDITNSSFQTLALWASHGRPLRPLGHGNTLSEFADSSRSG